MFNHQIIKPLQFNMDIQFTLRIYQNNDNHYFDIIKLNDEYVILIDLFDEQIYTKLNTIENIINYIIDNKIGEYYKFEICKDIRIYHSLKTEIYLIYFNKLNIEMLIQLI